MAPQILRLMMSNTHPPWTQTVVMLRSAHQWKRQTSPHQQALSSLPPTSMVLTLRWTLISVQMTGKENPQVQLSHRQPQANFQCRQTASHGVVVQQ
ncbi:hypothetical protein ACOMHN_030738 [Nucella lapillus]